MCHCIQYILQLTCPFPQVPHIAMYCQEMKSSYLHVVPQYLLPMVVKFLTDMNNQVKNNLVHSSSRLRADHFLFTSVHI